MALDWPVELLVLFSVDQYKNDAINGTDTRELHGIDTALSQTMKWEWVTKRSTSRKRSDKGKDSRERERERERVDGGRERERGR